MVVVLSACCSAAAYLCKIMCTVMSAGGARIIPSSLKRKLVSYEHDESARARDRWGIPLFGIIVRARNWVIKSKVITD